MNVGWVALALPQSLLLEAAAPLIVPATLTGLEELPIVKADVPEYTPTSIPLVESCPAVMSQLTAHPSPVVRDASSCNPTRPPVGQLRVVERAPVFVHPVIA